MFLKFSLCSPRLCDLCVTFLTSLYKRKGRRDAETREKVKLIRDLLALRLPQLLAVAFYLVTQLNDRVEIPRCFVRQLPVKQLGVFKHRVAHKRFNQIAKVSERHSQRFW